jgi:hypothetical protein
MWQRPSQGGRRLSKHRLAAGAKVAVIGEAGLDREASEIRFPLIKAIQRQGKPKP